MAHTSNHKWRDIDIELLIQEVKARPALYDRSVPEYSDVRSKKTMWEEVTATLYNDTWEDLSEKEKEAKVAEVVKRWSNLRTCFTRELKIMRDPLQNKRKKYLYFDKLLFLLDDMQQGSFSVIDTEMIDTDLNFDQEYEDTDHKNNYATQGNKSEKTTERLEKYVQESIKKLREEFVAKGNSRNLIETNTFNPDSDINFLVSMAPMLKMIPVDKKIDARIEMLSILKKYTSAETISYQVPKLEKDESVSDESSEILSLFGDEK